MTVEISSYCSSALHTPLVDLLGCDYPIIAAGMGGVARHQLAAAVSNAGGFGCLGMVRERPKRIHEEVAIYRELSERPFAVNIIPAATDKVLLKQQVNACIELRVPAVVLFWDVNRDLIRQLKDAGILVIHQVGSRYDAEYALRAEVDVLIAQGVEAGGHVRGQVSIMSLLPEIVSMSTVPVVAAGGIASGEGLLACLALGAQGICCGSAFLATHEANAHTMHQRRLVEAKAEDAIYSHRFYRNWPMAAPVRVLSNAVIKGDYDYLRSRGEETIIGKQDGEPVYLFSTDSPLADATGDVSAMALYAGQSCGQINEICSASERLKQFVLQADACLHQFLGGAQFEVSQPTASSPCFESQEALDIDPAYTGKMSNDELVGPLQLLMEAERAGARIAAHSLNQTKNPKYRAVLKDLHRREAKSCRLLRSSLQILDVEPSRGIGEFYDKAMAVPNMRDRLKLIDKGQAWVQRRLHKLIPCCAHRTMIPMLQEVLRLHSSNHGC